MSPSETTSGSTVDLLSVPPCRLVLGLIIGAIFVQYANWSWVFWFVALVALPISAVCCFLVPSPHRVVDDLPTKGRWRTLDLGGVSVLTGKFARVEAFWL